MNMFLDCTIKRYYKIKRHGSKVPFGYPENAEENPEREYKKIKQLLRGIRKIKTKWNRATREDQFPVCLPRNYRGTTKEIRSLKTQNFPHN